jgi:hypothetical protein
MKQNGRKGSIIMERDRTQYKVTRKVTKSLERE